MYTYRNLLSIYCKHSGAVVMFRYGCDSGSVDLHAAHGIVLLALHSLRYYPTDKQVALLKPLEAEMALLIAILFTCRLYDTNCNFGSRSIAYDSIVPEAIGTDMIWCW